jgi:phospholipase C
MTRASLLATTLSVAILSASSGRAASPDVVLQPAAPPAIAGFVHDPAQQPDIPQDQLTALLRTKIKYLFVLFQENRSFDSYYGSFPGVDGLFSQPPEQTPTVRRARSSPSASARTSTPPTPMMSTTASPAWSPR